MRIALPRLTLTLFLTGLGQTANLTAQDFQPEDYLHVADVGCASCHDVRGLPDSALAWITPRPAASFESLGAGVSLQGLRRAFGRRHSGLHAIETPMGADAAVWVKEVTHFLHDRHGRELEETRLQPGAVLRGATLFEHLACAACHTNREGLCAELAAGTDARGLSEFLHDPTRKRPGLDHNFQLTKSEAEDLAAFFLEDTIAESGAPTPGYLATCFEMQIRGGGRPDLDGRDVARTSSVEEISVAPRTRDEQYALRFMTTLRIDTPGQYRFEIGSDDGSWLDIDGAEVVDNGGLKPYGTKEGQVFLAQGDHALRLVFTQAGGGARLTLRFAVPERDGGTAPKDAWQDIPLTQLDTNERSLRPPTQAQRSGGPASETAIQNGSRWWHTAGCATCHTSAGGAATGDTPSPMPRTPITAGEGGGEAACRVIASEGVRSGQQTLRTLATISPTHTSAAQALAVALTRHRCTTCHATAAGDGLTPDVRAKLAEVEDLGEEGRLPPSLVRAGERFRPAWIQRVLTAAVDPRPYMRARCVELSDEDADSLATLFANAAAERGVPADREPEFSEATLELGRTQIGIGAGGKACISCHTVQGRPSLGVQGFDLAIQSERLRPAWFREWLKRPHELRPGTRMPAFWMGADEVSSRREIDAVRLWCNLGGSAPQPVGLAKTDNSVLAVGERPRLHAAFLDRLSARCLAVGTDARTHFAWDLTSGRLRWLWRGAFLDGSGTWSGRAGALIKPAGTDWIELPEGHGHVNAANPARLVARTMDAEGYPTLILDLGDGARLEDSLRPRFTERGSVLVRTLRAVGGPVTLNLKTSPQPACQITSKLGTTDRVIRASETSQNEQASQANQTIPAGQQMEVIYSW